MRGYLPNCCARSPVGKMCTGTCSWRRIVVAHAPARLIDLHYKGRQGPITRVPNGMYSRNVRRKRLHDAPPPPTVGTTRVPAPAKYVVPDVIWYAFESEKSLRSVIRKKRPIKKKLRSS